MKNIKLTLQNEESLSQIARALSSPIRLQILQLLNEQSLSVNEVAQTLGYPVSSTATNLSVLENCGLVATKWQPGAHGQMKICTRDCDSLFVQMHTTDARGFSNSIAIPMPIGQYTDSNVRPFCGLIGENRTLVEDNDPTAFYAPERIEAQLIWFSSGYLEYRFPKSILNNATPLSLELSFEACSEAPFYRNNWPSDITVWIAHQEIGTWTCPGDFGGRHGHFTPPWWSETLTQYGLLKTWMVDATGSYLDSMAVSDVTLDSLKLKELPYIPVRIGVKEDAENVGGINLFGDKFGDHPQGLLLTIHYRMD